MEGIKGHMLWVEGQSVITQRLLPSIDHKGRKWGTRRWIRTRVPTAAGAVHRTVETPWKRNTEKTQSEVSLTMKGGRSKAESKKADAKLSVKKAAAGKKPVKKGKPVKDPNKPKRPASAFFVFMEDFRKTYKEKHPNNKSVAAVGKAGGDKWKSLSEAEKAPFVAKAEKRKAEYEKTLQAYNKRIVIIPPLHFIF
ncbi:hypothetical protein BUALT_Bualt11G0040700 [Buddleja alternifolia]|uniref:HMG box domain-containing protein n=1 Tax=Buddleja alternifolia TaxID=168488 RepID=A0AAV6WX97_9LAMI|nr:hypothetical protein BUALT_Bualt11G0040700 [Buddleja alternifolia]